MSAAAPPAAAPPTVAPLAGARLWIAAISISLGFFLVILDITIANVSVPHIAGALGASPTQGTWVITSYSVAEAICLPLAGWLARRLGTIRTFTYGLIIFMIASALCGMATTLPMLIVFRVLQGFAGAPLLPLSQALLLRIFPKDKAGLAMAISAMTAVVAPITGPILGGTITDNLSWRWIFYLNVPVVLVCVPLVTRLLGRFETPRTIERIDVIGLLLLIIWVGALQVMLDLGSQRDWLSSTLIVALAIVAAIGFLTFLIWELTDDVPIVDLRVLRHRGFWTSTVCVSIGYASMMVGIVLVPLWAQTTMGYTATIAGYVLAPSSLFSLLCVPLAGRLVNKGDARHMIFWGLCWLGVVTLIRAHTAPTMDMFWIAFPQLLIGMSTAFYMVGLTVLALGSVEPQEIASAAGLMAFVRTLANAACVTWATTEWEDHTRVARSELVNVLNNAGGAMNDLVASGLSEMQARVAIERMVDTQSATIAYDHVFVIVGIACLLAAQLIWLIPKPRKH